MTPCALCGKPVNTHGPGVWRRVSGWEKVRRTGEGVHPLKGRDYGTDYAHELCIDIAQRGGEQESLLA